MINHTPAYNLKVVMRETGLNAAVLRAWERRYGIPAPQRTPGGHRLYSQWDIETLKWLMARQAEGLTISRAVEQWKEITTAGRDLLSKTQQGGISPSLNYLPPPVATVDSFRQSWLDACLRFDEVAADQTLNQAFSIIPVEVVCSEVLQRGISDMGEKYYHGEVSVHQEHFASALAMRRFDMLIAATPPPTRPQSILLGCPPDEWHTFSVLLLTLLLRRKGFQVVYLGASIPPERLEETVRVIQPDLIIMVAHQLTTAATLRSIALMLKDKDIPLAYGGRIFNQVPEVRQHIPGQFLGESIDAAVQAVGQLLLAPEHVPGTPLPDEMQQPDPSLYWEKRPHIESVLYETLRQRNLPTEHIDTANYYLGNGLVAVLELGNPSYLTAYVNWLQGLLTAHDIPRETIIPYLDAYSTAVRTVMGEDYSSITDWIDSYIASQSQ